MEAVTPSGERVDNEENKPATSVEIVWYKDYGLDAMKKCAEFSERTSD